MRSRMQLRDEHEIICALYGAIAARQFIERWRLAVVLQPCGVADWMVGRCLQKMRKAGQITYNRAMTGWEVAS